MAEDEPIVPYRVARDAIVVGGTGIVHGVCRNDCDSRPQLAYQQGTISISGSKRPPRVLRREVEGIAGIQTNPRQSPPGGAYCPMIASATRMPSAAADVMPPAYPAPSPAG